MNHSIGRHVLVVGAAIAVCEVFGLRPGAVEIAPLKIIAAAIAREVLDSLLEFPCSGKPHLELLPRCLGCLE